VGGHAIYESRRDLARLLLADFDRDVAAIAAQLRAAEGRKPAAAAQVMSWRTVVRSARSETAMAIAAMSAAAPRKGSASWVETL
jgi:hypothetical protein